MNPNETPYTPFTYDEFYSRYYVHRVAVLAVIRNRDSILLTYQFRGKKKNWGLPGGLLEKGEPMKMGLEREILEETNIRIKPRGILALSDWAGDSIFDNDPYKHNGIGIVFGADYLSGEPIPDKKEVFEVKFFTKKELEESNISSFTLKCFEAYQNNSSLFLEKEKYISSESYIYGYGPFKI